jgi:hypothetical protein
MPEMLNDNNYQEEWKVVLSSKGEYTLSKNQALVLKQEIASGNRGTVMFETFAIAIPYIVEFFRVKRFLVGEFQLPAQASEKPYVPISEEKWEQIQKEVYEKIGRS